MVNGFPLSAAIRLSAFNRSMAQRQRNLVTDATSETEANGKRQRGKVLATQPNRLKAFRMEN